MEPIQRMINVFVFFAYKALQMRATPIYGKLTTNGFDYSHGKMEDDNFMIVPHYQEYAEYLMKKQVPSAVFSFNRVSIHHYLGQTVFSFFYPSNIPMKEIIKEIGMDPFKLRENLLKAKVAFFWGISSIYDIRTRIIPIKDRKNCSVAVLRALTNLFQFNYIIGKPENQYVPSSVMSKYRSFVHAISTQRSEDYDIKWFEKIFPEKPSDNCILREYLSFVLNELAKSSFYQWIKINELNNPYVEAMYNNKVVFNIIDNLFSVVIKKENKYQFIRILELKNVERGRNSLASMISNLQMEFHYFPYYLILSREDIGPNIEDIPFEGFDIIPFLAKDNLMKQYEITTKYRLVVIIIKGKGNIKEKGMPIHYYGYYYNNDGGGWNRIDNSGYGGIGYPDIETMLSPKHLPEFKDEYEKNKALLIFEREDYPKFQMPEEWRKRFNEGKT